MITQCTGLEGCTISVDWQTYVALSQHAPQTVCQQLLDDCSRGLFQPALQPSETACQSLRRSHSCLIASTHQCEQLRPVVKLSSCAGHPEWYTRASQNLPGVCGPVPGSGTTQGHRCPSRVREAARAVGGVRQRGRPGAVPAGVFAESSCCLMLQSPSNCCTQEADALDLRLCISVTGCSSVDSHKSALLPSAALMSVPHCRSALQTRSAQPRAARMWTSSPTRSASECGLLLSSSQSCALQVEAAPCAALLKLTFNFSALQDAGRQLDEEEQEGQN